MARDPDTGQFLKGADWDGNPNGRPKHHVSFREALRDRISKAQWAEELAWIAGNRKHRDQLQALTYIGNWIEGSPRQVMSIDSSEADAALLLARAIYSRLSGENISSEPLFDAETQARLLPADLPSEPASQET